MGGQEKEWMVYFLDDLRAFDINADQWTTAAQDKARGNDAERRNKGRNISWRWIAAEEARAGLRHAVACPNVTGRTKKRISQSKRTRAGSLALVDQPQVGANLYPPGVWFADAMTSSSGVSTFVLFCFVFVFMLSLKPRAFVQSPFDRFSRVYVLYRCRFLLV